MTWPGSASPSPPRLRRGKLRLIEQFRENGLSVSRRTPHGAPAVLEARPKNEVHDRTVTAHALFDTVRLQVAVVHLPGRAPQHRQIASAQARDDGGHVAARSLAQMA